MIVWSHATSFTSSYHDVTLEHTWNMGWVAPASTRDARHIGTHEVSVVQMLCFPNKCFHKTLSMAVVDDADGFLCRGQPGDLLWLCDELSKIYELN